MGTQCGHSPPSRRGAGQVKLRHGEGTSRALASIRWYGRYGAALPPASAKRPRRGDPISSARAYIPDPLPSPPYGLQPESALPVPEQSPTKVSAPPHDSSPRPAERPPPPHLELGLAGSASAPWNMVALSSSAPQPRFNRTTGRAGLV